MKRRREANGMMFGAALVLSGALSGCTEPVNWWQPQRRAEAPPPPAETTDAVDPATVGAPDEIRSLSEPTAGEAPAPDTLEARIRAYLEQFPESGDGATQAATAPDATTAHATQSGGDSAEGPRLAGTMSPAQPTDGPVTAVNAPAQAAAPQQPPSFQAAPTLESISIEADHLSAPPAPVGGVRLTSTSAAGAADTGASVAIQTSEQDVNVMIQRLERTVAENPNDLDAQVRLRMLYLVAGREEDARRDPQGLSAEKAAMIRRLVEVLTETRSAAANLDLGADGALAAVEGMRAELRRFADLSIPRMILCSRVDSFGAYSPIEPASFLRGAPVAAVVYCELTNFISKLDEEGQHVTHLSQRIELLDEGGQRVWLREEQEIVDRCRNKREDFFLAPVVQIRESLPAGTYHLRVEIQDRESGKVTSASTPLTVVEPISGLTAGATAAARGEAGVLRAPS